MLTNYVMSFSWSLYLSLSLYWLYSLVIQCLLITLIKCLKGHKSVGLLFEGFCKCFCLCHCFCHCLLYCLFFDQMSQWSQVSFVSLNQGGRRRCWHLSLNHPPAHHPAKPSQGIVSHLFMLQKCTNKEGRNSQLYISYAQS